jgi:hypothetical protein
MSSIAYVSTLGFPYNEMNVCSSYKQNVVHAGEVPWANTTTNGTADFNFVVALLCLFLIAVRV